MIPQTDTLTLATLPTDSLVVVADSATDTLQLLPSAADSLVTEVVPEAVTAPVDSVLINYREVAATELFGARSEQASLPHPIAAPYRVTDSGGFSVIVLALVGLYALLIYRHPSDVWQLLLRLTRDHSTDDRLYEDSAGGFTRFLNLCNLLGLGLVSAVVIRLAAPLIPAAQTALMPHAAAALWCVALLAVLLVAVLYRAAVGSVVGLLTFTRPLFERLFLIKRSSVALLTVVAMPPAALWLLTESPIGWVWLAVIFIELIVAVVLYLYETRQLFLSKKISILHWILYLCGVEIFPLSLLWLGVARLA